MLPVQIAGNSVSVAATTNIKALPQNVAAGNLIFVVVGNRSNSNFPNNVTDNQGNAYTFWDLQQSGVAACVTTWFAVASASGPLTVTATWGGNEISDLIAAEYLASGGVPAIDNNQSNTNATTAATSLASGNITTTANNDLVISWGYDANRDGSPWTDSAGGTLEKTTQNAGGASLSLFDRIKAAAGLTSDTITATNGVIGDNLLAGIIAFKNIGGGGPAQPTASCNSPQLGHVGKSYTHAFSASGGTPPYTAWAITVGSLPPGITLNAATGVVSGTPTTAGTYAFTIQVTDSLAQTSTAACSITINSQNSGPATISTGSQFFASGPVSLFAANGALYSVQQTIGTGGGGINGTAVFKSTDNGDTWTEMDTANAPIAALGWPVFDVANNRLLFGLVTATNPVTQQNLFLKPYNFSTDTWGANFATGGPAGENPVQFTFLRPDGSVVVIYDTGSGLNPGGTTRLRAAVWNGVSWSASIDLGAAILPSVASGNVAVSSAVAAMDTGGNIHIAFNDSNRTTFFYQLLSGTTLGSSHQFTETFQTQRPAWGNMLIVGSTVVIAGVTQNANNTFFIGTGLSAPVWSSVTPAAIQPATAIRQPGIIAVQGSTIYWLLNFAAPEANFADAYKLAQSTDGGATWSLYPQTSVSPFFYDFAASSLAANTDNTFATSATTAAILSVSGSATFYALTNARNTVAGFNAGYFMASLVVGGSSPVSSPATAIAGPGGGTQFLRGGCRPFNHYDHCLLLEIEKFRKIQPLPPCSVPQELWGLVPWQEEFGSLPEQAVPFRRIASIVTPAAAAGDQFVVTDIVPQGYDGLITGLYWRYNGINFIEGSGDIFWRVQINQRFVKDLSNIGFTLGSPQEPLPMVEGGQLLQSRQRFGVVVNVPDISGTIQVGSATITAGLFGFFWPKGVPGWTGR